MHNTRNNHRCLIAPPCPWSDISLHTTIEQRLHFDVVTLTYLCYLQHRRVYWHRPTLVCRRDGPTARWSLGNTQHTSTAADAPQWQASIGQWSLSLSYHGLCGRQSKSCMGTCPSIRSHGTGRFSLWQQRMDRVECLVGQHWWSQSSQELPILAIHTDVDSKISDVNVNAVATVSTASYNLASIFLGRCCPITNDNISISLSSFPLVL